MNIPHWASLRTMGNSPIVKFTIVIPVIGYLILFNEMVLPYLQLARTIFDPEGTWAASAVSPRLMSIYFGLWWVALASILYQLNCPKIVKQFASSTDYVAASQEHIGAHTLKSIEEYIKKQSQIYADHVREIHSRAAQLYKADDVRASVARDVLDLQFVVENRRAPYMRAAITALYGVGAVFLSIPSIDVLLRVLKLMVLSI